MRKQPHSPVLLAIILIIISACSGGGKGSDNAVLPELAGQPTTTPTKILVRVNLTGSLPAKTDISGVGFVLRLPDNVTALISNDTVDAGVVTPSGTFQESILVPPTYTRATGGKAGTLRIIMAHTNPSGTNRLGEIAVIDLQLIGGVVPQANDFELTGTTAVDLSGNNIADAGFIVVSIEAH